MRRPVSLNNIPGVDVCPGREDADVPELGYDCVCMCVCMCMTVYVCVYVCVWLCMYVNDCACMCITEYVCVWVCMYVCMYVCVCLYRTLIHKHDWHMHAQHAYIHIPLSSCRILNQYQYACTHTYTYINNFHKGLTYFFAQLQDLYMYTYIQKHSWHAYWPPLNFFCANAGFIHAHIHTHTFQPCILHNFLSYVFAQLQDFYRHTYIRMHSWHAYTPPLTFLSAAPGSIHAHIYTYTCILDMHTDLLLRSSLQLQGF
jgi:hypothetical protein